MLIGDSNIRGFKCGNLKICEKHNLENRQDEEF